MKWKVDPSDEFRCNFLNYVTDIKRSDGAKKYAYTVVSKVMKDLMDYGSEMIYHYPTQWFGKSNDNEKFAGKYVDFSISCVRHGNVIKIVDFVIKKEKKHE